MVLAGVSVGMPRWYLVVVGFVPSNWVIRGVMFFMVFWFCWGVWFLVGSPSFFLMLFSSWFCFWLVASSHSVGVFPRWLRCSVIAMSVPLAGKALPRVAAMALADFCRFL